MFQDVSDNPMVRLYGATEGKKCNECKHFYKELYRGGRYLKCALRGRGSDHRSSYDACKKFEEKEQ